MQRQTTFLALLLFIAISQNCTAQKRDTTDDVHDNKQTTTKSSVSITDDLSYNIDDFIKGDVMMSSGDVLKGTLRFNGNVVIFKDTITQKTKRYHAQDIKGFVTAVPDTLKTSFFNRELFSLHPDKHANEIRYLARGPKGFFKADTFKVYTDTSNAIPNEDLTLNERINYYFIKVMIYGPKLCLYKTLIIDRSPGMMTGGGMMTPGWSSMYNKFYLKRNNETQYTEVPSGKRKFKKTMALYFKDDASLVDDINKEILKYSMIDKIVDRYNQQKNAE